MRCCCCTSPKQVGVFLIVSVWTQLLCSLVIVTKTAFLTEKGVDEWSYVIFSAYLVFSVVICSCTILWGIQTFLKQDTVGTNQLKWVSALCTTVSIMIFTITYIYNETVLQHSELDLDFRLASIFLYIAVGLFLLVLMIDHPYQPLNVFFNVSGYKLIALLWIHFVAVVYCCLAYSYLYFGRIPYIGLLVASIVQIPVLGRLCMIISIKMDSNASKTVTLGRVSQAMAWQLFIMHCILAGSFVSLYMAVDEVNEIFGDATICYIIFYSLYAYLVLDLDLRSDHCLQDTLLQPVVDGVESAAGATTTEDYSNLRTSPV